MPALTAHAMLQWIIKTIARRIPLAVALLLLPTVALAAPLGLAEFPNDAPETLYISYPDATGGTVLTDSAANIPPDRAATAHYFAVFKHAKVEVTAEAYIELARRVRAARDATAAKPDAPPKPQSFGSRLRALFGGGETNPAGDAPDGGTVASAKPDPLAETQRLLDHRKAEEQRAQREGEENRQLRERNRQQIDEEAAKAAERVAIAAPPATAPTAVPNVRDAMNRLPVGRIAGAVFACAWHHWLVLQAALFAFATAFLWLWIAGSRVQSDWTFRKMFKGIAIYLALASVAGALWVRPSIQRFTQDLPVYLALAMPTAPAQDASGQPSASSVHSPSAPDSVASPQ